MAKEGESDKSTPLEVIEVLKSFEDVMSSNLPMNLSSQWDIDYKIELMLGVKLQENPPYRMALLELAELQK